ncbi:MAG: terminase small subunit, partial [Gammaproteobacteria bacterium]|nr:terminase small subunit [Gammaproteobacteria bacterium]
EKGLNLYENIRIMALILKGDGLKGVKLTVKQKRFCEEYILSFSATKAAEKAGYSSRSAGAIGCDLLKNPKIMKYIGFFKHETAKKLKVSHEMLTKEWAKIAFSSISHLHNTWIERKEFEELRRNDPDILDCIQEISTEIKKTKIPGMEKGAAIEVEYVKLKLYNKQVALENLGKHLGYYELDNQQPANALSTVMKSFKVVK